MDERNDFWLGEMKAVILANGEFPSRQELLYELQNGDFLIVCDGAIMHLEKLQIVPNVIIGDLDSFPHKLRKKYEDKLVYLQDQETNDLSKAFFYGVSLGFDDFLILGATGLREDHALGNISLLAVFVRHCKRVIIKSDYGEFSSHFLPCKLKSSKGEQISIFCLDSSVKMTSRNLKYPLQSLRLPILATGTLNEALGEEFELFGDREAVVIVYRAY